jgi:hypothetical protein
VAAALLLGAASDLFVAVIRGRCKIYEVQFSICIYTEKMRAAELLNVNNTLQQLAKIF